jgi:hypothetical protein
MPIYWFYELQAVARRNLLTEDLWWTDTFVEAWREVLKARQHRPHRERSKIPLP